MANTLSRGSSVVTLFVLLPLAMAAGGWVVEGEGFAVGQLLLPWIVDPEANGLISLCKERPGGRHGAGREITEKDERAVDGHRGR